MPSSRRWITSSEVTWLVMAGASVATVVVANTCGDSCAYSLTVARDSHSLWSEPQPL